MEYAKRIAWMVAGVLIAWLTTGFIRAQANEQPSRLTVSATASVDGKEAHFIKDQKSEGCWLLVASRTRDGEFALAAAPPLACQRN